MGGRFAELITREISVGEGIMKSPHKSLCEYRGVIVHPKLGVTGFECFVQAGLFRTGLQFSTFMVGLPKGVSHLNSLGFGHNDIRPANIFVKIEGKDTFQAAIEDPEEFKHTVHVVLGDFDAVVPLEKWIDIKAAPAEWWSVKD